MLWHLGICQDLEALGLLAYYKMIEAYINGPNVGGISTKSTQNITP